MQITRRRSLGTVVLATALAFGGAVATSVPAQAAGTYRLTTAKTYSQATTQTSGGTWGQSRAYHGCASSVSAWSQRSTLAYASCGSQYGSAQALFR